MTLAVLNLLLAAYLAGVIWVVQVVHYPLFADVGDDAWRAYEAGHRRRITVVVLGPMVAQLVVGTLLLADAGDAARPLAIASLALAGGCFALTAIVFAPMHERLSAGPDRRLVRRLVTANWSRTVAWTVQAVVAARLVALV